MRNLLTVAMATGALLLASCGSDSAEDEELTAEMERETDDSAAAASGVIETANEPSTAAAGKSGETR